MDDEMPVESVRIRANVLGQSFEVPAHLCSVSGEGTAILSPDLEAFFRVIKTLTDVDGSLTFDYPSGGAPDG